MPVGRLVRSSWVADLGSQIDTSVDIAAPAETVWGVLTDLGCYPLWNPFITRIAGDLRVGQRLTVRLQPPNGHDVSPEITSRRTQPAVGLARAPVRPRNI